MKNPLKQLKEVSNKKLLILAISVVAIVLIIVVAPMFYKNYVNSKRNAVIEKQKREAAAKKREIESKASSVKKWPESSQESIGAKNIKLETKWQAGYFLYMLDVELTEGPSIIKKNRSNYSGFYINFLDSDGFKVYSVRIPLNSMTSIVNSENVIVGLSVNEKEAVKVDEYLTFDSVSIGWNF